MAGFEGVSRALKTMNLATEVEASNLVRSQIPGAKKTTISLQGDGDQFSIAETRRDQSQGSIVQTDSQTSLALQGGGFFLLQDTSGRTFLTRRGDFHFDSTGKLVNGSGLSVLSFDPVTGALGTTDKLTAGGLGGPGDAIHFNGLGQVVNETQGGATGRQLVVASVPNPLGLESASDPEIFQVTSGSGSLSLQVAGEDGMGTVIPQAYEASTASLTEGLAGVGFWQRNFGATASAMKTFLTALDDIIALFRPA